MCLPSLVDDAWNASRPYVDAVESRVHHLQQALALATAAGHKRSYKGQPHRGLLSKTNIICIYVGAWGQKKLEPTAKRVHMRFASMPSYYNATLRHANLAGTLPYHPLRVQGGCFDPLGKYPSPEGAAAILAIAH